MSYDVFISYSRAASRSHAVALAGELCPALGADKVFLDTSEIAPGAQFPDELASAVAHARVVVVFADAKYFSRPWCVREFEAALGDGESAHTVLVAGPLEGDLDALLLHLPPFLARRAWPQANETQAIASMVTRALGAGLDRNLVFPADSALRPEGVVPPRPWRTGQIVAADAAPDTLGEGFVGREQMLWAIFRGLETRRAGGRGRSVLLHGGAGSGKSQLAGEYLHRAGPRHYDLICWLDADVPDKQWKEQLAALASRLGTVPGAGDPRPHLAAACATRDRDGQRILWIVDNLPEPQTGQPAMPLSHWCPAPDHVSLLLTSRRPQVHGCDETIFVDALPPADGMRMLTRPAVDPRWLPSADWLAIARWVGGLPLALRILQAGLADGSLTAQALRDAVDTNEPAPALDEEVAQLAEVMPAGALRGIGDALGASLTALDSQPLVREALSVLAQLQPWALPEALVDLVASAGERAVLARRGWLQSSTGADGRRVWRLHRIAASFVRSRTQPMEGERALLQRLGDSIELERIALPSTRELGNHLLKILEPMIARINRAQEFPQATVDAGRRFGTMAAFFRLADPQWRGLRYIGAGWAWAFNATAEVIARAQAVLASGDESEVAALPAALQAAGRVDEVAAIVAEVLRDARDAPRWQAIVHAGSYSAPVILEPLWQAIASEPNEAVRQNGMPVLRRLMNAPDAPLRSLLSLAASRAQDPSPAVRSLVAKSFAAALEAMGEDGSAGGFTAATLRSTLLHRLREETDGAVRHELARALGVRHAEPTWRALNDALQGATNAKARALAQDDLVAYLRAVERPAAPPAAAYNIDDEGRTSLQLHFPGKGNPRSELWQPLVEIAVDSDGAGDDSALAALEPGTGGHQALAKLFEAILYERNAPAAALRLAQRCVDLFPDQANLHWWRAMAREATGDADGALEDLLTVIAATPQFGYAFKRIARLRWAKGERDAARVALAHAQALIPDDPEVAELAASMAV